MSKTSRKRSKERNAFGTLGSQRIHTPTKNILFHFIESSENFKHICRHSPNGWYFSLLTNVRALNAVKDHFGYSFSDSADRVGRPKCRETLLFYVATIIKSSLVFGRSILLPTCSA